MEAIGCVEERHTRGLQHFPKMTLGLRRKRGPSERGLRAMWPIHPERAWSATISWLKRPTGENRRGVFVDMAATFFWNVEEKDKGSMTELKDQKLVG